MLSVDSYELTVPEQLAIRSKLQENESVLWLYHGWWLCLCACIRCDSALLCVYVCACVHASVCVRVHVSVCACVREFVHYLVYPLPYVSIQPTSKDVCSR